MVLRLVRTGVNYMPAKLLPDGECSVRCGVCGSAVMKVIIDQIEMKIESLCCPVCDSYMPVTDGQLDIGLFLGEKLPEGDE